MENVQIVWQTNINIQTVKLMPEGTDLVRHRHTLPIVYGEQIILLLVHSERKQVTKRQNIHNLLLYIVHYQ